MELIRSAPWREAVTYRDTWPHEYVMVKRDRQEELLAAFCVRIAQGEGVECWFFHQKRKYLFLGDHKYWTMTDCPDIDLEADDYVLNRALLYHDRRDFVIERGDTGRREEKLAMTDPDEGMEYVDVHKMWQYEDRDFTPWLFDNLDMLSKALGMSLETVQMEASVGPFSCDIVAKEVGSGVTVAIENQLELTNHSHLGQLLTYAAGLDAQVAVWIAPDFLDEHAEALHQLNGWTGDGPRFYGVKVMMLKNGNALEPRLCPVVTPDGWNKELTLSQAEVDPRKQQFHAFFQPIIDHLIKARFADKATQNFGKTGRIFPSHQNPGLGYAMSLEGNNDAWVTLQIRMEDNDLTKTVFDQLRKDRGTIEAHIPDQEWKWNQYRLFSSINVRRDGSIDDPPEKLDETRAWMLDLLPKFKEVFDPRVADILKELRAKRAG